MHPFEQLIYDRFAQSIAAWDIERNPDIYVISFLYGDGASMDASEQEVILQADISLSYNTLSHYESQISRASSAEEAKWNYAFWLHENGASVPRDFSFGSDPPVDELALRDSWCLSLGISPDGSDEGGRPTYGAALYEATRGACQRVAQALHENGVIVRKTGRAIPIVIHDLEQCNEKDRAATRAANPPALLPEIEPLL